MLPKSFFDNAVEAALRFKVPGITIAMEQQQCIYRPNVRGFSKEFLDMKTWGGEDWNIIDGAIEGGSTPWIYHYYHTNAGMW